MGTRLAMLGFVVGFLAIQVACGEQTYYPDEPPVAVWNADDPAATLGPVPCSDDEGGEDSFDLTNTRPEAIEPSCVNLDCVEIPIPATVATARGTTSRPPWAGWTTSASGIRRSRKASSRS